MNNAAVNMDIEISESLCSVLLGVYPEVEMLNEAEKSFVFRLIGC